MYVAVSSGGPQIWLTHHQNGQIKRVYFRNSHNPSEVCANFQSLAGNGSLPSSPLTISVRSSVDRTIKILKNKMWRIKHEAAKYFHKQQLSRHPDRNVETAAILIGRRVYTFFVCWPRHSHTCLVLASIGKGQARRPSFARPPRDITQSECTFLHELFDRGKATFVCLENKASGKKHTAAGWKEARNPPEFRMWGTLLHWSVECFFNQSDTIWRNPPHSNNYFLELRARRTVAGSIMSQ